MKRFIIFILTLFVWLGLYAEHLFEAGLRMGMADFIAQTTYVSPMPDLHAGLQFSYSYHSPYVIGARIGITADYHRAAFGKNNYTDTYTTIDVDGDPLQIDYTIGKLRETYTTWSVGVPVQLALSYKHVNFYVGPKIVFPFVCQWTETVRDAALSVYFPLQENRVYESFPLAASRAFDETQSGTRPVDKVQWWLAAELSYDLTIHASDKFKSYLSVGVYADFALGRETAEPNEQLSLIMLSDTRDGFPLHRILSPVVGGNRLLRHLVTQLSPFNVGVKISYRFAPYNPYNRNAKNCNCL